MATSSRLRGRLPRAYALLVARLGTHAPRTSVVHTHGDGERSDSTRYALADGSVYVEMTSGYPKASIHVSWQPR